MTPYWGFPSYPRWATVLTPSYLGLLTAVLTSSYMGLMSCFDNAVDDAALAVCDPRLFYEFKATLGVMKGALK